MQPTPSQFWTKDLEKTTRLGVTAEFAEAIKGSCVSLELSLPGSMVNAGETFGFLTTDVETYDLQAPVRFKIEKINPHAIGHPPLVVLSPLAQGWLVEFSSVSA